jgi:hypothetical protein
VYRTCTVDELVRLNSEFTRIVELRTVYEQCTSWQAGEVLHLFTSWQAKDYNICTTLNIVIFVQGPRPRPVDEI